MDIQRLAACRHEPGKVGPFVFGKYMSMKDIHKGIGSYASERLHPASYLPLTDSNSVQGGSLGGASAQDA